MHKHIIGIVVLIITLFFLGQHLNPMDKTMFMMHDGTQVGRSATFAENIRSGHVPPRIAPEYSYHLGYPLFNYYSPAAYWITAIPILLDVYPITALKLSFLGALAVAFIGMFLWLQKRFSTNASLIGAIGYVACPYFAVEIFVRGNLAEAWFLALFPLTLYFYDRLAGKSSHANIVLTAVFTSLTLTVHNVMSPIALLLIIGYMLMRKIKNAPKALIFGILLSSYFLIPAILESGITQSIAIASKTQYRDHFLCLSQLWSSKSWSFGGSVAGCEGDGFSFKMGKVHIVLGLIGIGIGLWSLFQKKHAKNGNKNELIAILALGLVSLFLTLYQSQFLWDAFAPVLRVFQFPWRLLVFVMFALAYMIAYGIHWGIALLEKTKVPAVLSILLCIVIGCVLLISNDQYFRRPGTTYEDYATQYLSDDYLKNRIAFHIPEYLPVSANLKEWLSYQTETGTPQFLLGVLDPPSKENKSNLYDRQATTMEQEFHVNIHHVSYWKIFVDNKEYVPTIFDSLGRPLVKLTKAGEHTVRVIYKQTPLEQLSNIISSLTLLVLLTGFTAYGRKTAQK